MTQLPTLAPPTTDLNFALTAEEVTATAERTMRISNKVYDEIAALEPAECTYESVILRLARLENMAISEVSKATFVQFFSPVKEARDASQAASQKLEEFEIEASMREDIYRAVKLASTRMPESADAEDRLLVERLLLNFERNGLALDPVKRDELKGYKKRISELAIQFSRNVAEDKSFVAFTREELDGMPDDYLESLTKLDNGKYKVTMAYPDRLPLLRKAKNPATRRAVDETAAKMCPENVAILEEIIVLRAKAAAVLGYKNHAEFKVEVNMAKTPETILTFLNDLRGKLVTAGQRDKAKLLELKAADHAERGLPIENELYSWDTAFYNTMLIEKEFNVDQDEVKQYFSFENVLKGILGLYSRLFNVTFTQTTDVATWHEDVVVYHVHDSTNGSYIGTYFLDMFPREGAYNHAAVFPLRPTCVLADGTSTFPVAAMKMNATKPLANTPSLFKHDEFVTFAHELGHAVHNQLSKTKHGRFHGTSTAGDFVEAPSQLLENWCWEPSVLAEIGVHYKTGEKMPADLIERLVATRNINAGMFNLRQLFFGLFDMEVHTRAVDNATVNTTELYNKLREEITLVPGAPNTFGHATFGHIVGGYDAGYYGYMWSLVFAADMYSRFEKDGIFNPATGLDYRREVLFPGSSRDEMESLRKFLGREPNSEAFLRKLGL
ncbi:metalloendopeptidase [Blastocladiella emersonii ATCC 22665]|nr:metalloendopeptidase [Blastocladiella emersonii ATCC 22665]